MDAWAQAWLDLQCRMIPGAARGMLLLGAPDAGPFSPVAAWPAEASASEALLEAAESALGDRQAVIREPKPEGEEELEADPRDAIALPLVFEGRLLGAVAVELPSRAEPQRRAVLQLLQWGAGWLEILLRQQAARSTDAAIAVLELVAVALAHDRFRAAATAVATELATRLGCERVAVGFASRGCVEVAALSHSAELRAGSDLARDLGAAMDEAVDQGRSVVFPGAPEGHPQVSRAHAELCRRHGAAFACTVPLADGGRAVGAITLERAGPLDRAALDLVEQIAGLVGPLLEARRREDRPLAAKAGEDVAERWRRLVGPGHLVLKAAALGTGLVLGFLTLATGTYRVTAQTTVEGTVQRAVVAALEGYIASAEKRAGDVVSAGDVLATLEDRDLVLEQRKWTGQRDQLAKEYRSAFAGHDASQVRILRAQLDQAEAELALIAEQLARTRMVAPFDGILVSGDLTQSLGSPVERGQVLFEVAPLESYRLILEVDERDVSRVRVDQRGQLALSAIPGARLAFAVDAVTPVASAEDGRNFFRVEARLEGEAPPLRPGMEGVAKVEIGERRLLWIWTHRLVDAVTLWAWSWWP